MAGAAELCMYNLLTGNSEHRPHQNTGHIKIQVQCAAHALQGAHSVLRPCRLEGTSHEAGIWPLSELPRRLMYVVPLRPAQLGCRGPDSWLLAKLLQHTPLLSAKERRHDAWRAQLYRAHACCHACCTAAKQTLLRFGMLHRLARRCDG